MTDSRQIENLIYTYAERMDAGDLAGVAALFADAEIHAGGSVQAGRDAVLAMYRGSVRVYEDTKTPKTKHLTTNVIVELDPPRARARSYYTVLQATDALPLQPIVAGRYADEFVCEGGRWRFVRREIFIDQLGDVSAHLLLDAARLR